MGSRVSVMLATSQSVPPPIAAAYPFSHDAAFGQAIGDPTGERVVIIGHDTLDLMCAVIRAGAAEVTLLRLRERPEAQEADLAILVGLASAQEASAAVMQARRALAPTGRIVIGTAAHLGVQEVAATLRAQGFAGVHAVAEGVVSAELPFFAPLGLAAHG